MERRRTIAGSPVRTTSESWSVLADIIASTLAASSSIDEAAVREECESVGPVLAAVIATDGLTGDRLTLVADPVYARLYVASGAAAFDAEADEQLGAIPGGASATDWRVYVDPPSLLEQLVEDGLADASHFVAGKAPKYERVETKSAAFDFDVTALGSR